MHSTELSFGQAHVFYPEATEERCTAAVLLEVDPVGLVRRGHGTPLLDQYVNDRPYVASSFLSVAIARLFNTAMSGRSKERQELADQPIALTARIAALPARRGEDLIRRLFEPLGYAVSVVGHALDAQFPDWGASPYFTVELSGRVRLAELLTHLYVLIPVLDEEKHYWIGDDEVAKLLRRGEGWLETHPEQRLIVDRYLLRLQSLTTEALARLSDDGRDPDRQQVTHDREEEAVEAPLDLNAQRLATVIAAVKASGAKSVVDLGCGEGKLLGSLLEDRQFERIVGLEVSHRALQVAARRLGLERMIERQRARIELIQGSLTYRDGRLADFDAATLVEVIEHLDPSRLSVLEQVVFGHARPGTVVVTTPNADYNVRFESLPAGRFRHRDHRFEWTREQLRAWATGVGERHGYRLRFEPVGPEDPELGPPTQMAVFER